MAKHGKVLPARRPRRRPREESILLSSAETIGRVIGTLQRQLDGARNRLSIFAVDRGLASRNGDADSSRPSRKAATVTTKRKTGSTARRNSPSTTKAKRAPKSTPARASAGSARATGRKGAKKPRKPRG